MVPGKGISKPISGSTKGSISETSAGLTRRIGWVGNWPLWAPYAAVAWSLMYAILGLYWALSGRGFPYTPDSASDILAPLAGRFGSALAWSLVILAGIPAMAVGIAMLRGLRRMRSLLIATGAVLAGVLLLLMTGLNLLVKVGYIPAFIFGLLTAARSQSYMQAWIQWDMVHQLLCLVGGFLWLAATVSYARKSGDACLDCGRSDSLEGWTNPSKARHWGRIAVYVAMVAPVFYALTRIAWAMGIPLGLTEEALRRGQETGTWIGGLSLAAFSLVGGALMLGLVQRWGEVFPRWMIGLAGRRVPVTLAMVPAALASVLLIVGGVGIWSGLPQMAANMAASGAGGREIIGATIFQVGPTLFFPIWGLALAVATMAYYYRRRGPCSVCGRGSAG